jgi:putative aldouronate transport system permease protein
LSFLFLFPFWNVLMLSLSAPQSVSGLNLRLVPTAFSLSAYAEVLTSEVIVIGYFNTVIRTAFGTALNIVVTFGAGYALSKKNLPLRRSLNLFILFTMFFSGGLIPQYLLIRNLGLINNRLALILPAATSAWTILVARGFVQSLPPAMEEAAWVDGAHPLVIAVRIALPLSAPLIAILALWSAVGHWNAWFDALIYVNDRSKLVLQLVLRKILIDQNKGNEMMGNLLTEQTNATTPETVRAATIIVSTAPIVAVYPFLQKYFVKGILIGAVKG